MRNQEIFSVVRDMIHDVHIEDLAIPYTAVATDLLGHKEIWFQEGPLHQAIRASIAIPSIVTPAILNGRVLVDGALLNPLPIIPTIAAHADYIFAVNLSGEEGSLQVLPDDMYQQTAGGEMEDWLDKIRDKASQWFDWDALRSFGGRRPITKEEVSEKAQEAVVEEAPKDHESDEHTNTIAWEKLGIGKFDIMNLTIETMQSALVQYKIAGYPPDMLVNVPKNACRTFDYHQAPEMIQLGRERMESALSRFESGEGSSGLLAL